MYAVLWFYVCEHNIDKNIMSIDSFIETNLLLINIDFQLMLSFALTFDVCFNYLFNIYYIHTPFLLS